MTTRRTEYSDDVILYNEDPMDVLREEDDSGTLKDELDDEDLIDWNSEYFLDMYLSLVQYCEDNHHPFMNKITFNQFCNFMLAHNK